MAEIWGREVEWDEWITMDRGESRDRLKTLSPCPRGQCGKQMRKELRVDLSYRHANVYALWRQWPFGHIWTSYVTLLHDILICFVWFCHLPIIPITRPCENGWNLGADLWSRFVIAVDGLSWDFWLRERCLKKDVEDQGQLSQLLEAQFFCCWKTSGTPSFSEILGKSLQIFSSRLSRRSVHFGEARHQDMCRLLWWLLPMSMLGAAKGFKAPGWTQQSGKMNSFSSGTIRMYLSTGHHMTNNIIII